MEQRVHESSGIAPPVLEKGPPAMEKVPPEVVEELKRKFSFMDLVGGREELPEEKVNTFLGDLRRLLDPLKDGEVQRLINEYKECTNVEMDFGTLDELFDHMKTTGRLREMFLLQSLLLRIGKEGLSEDVAALAKETWGRQDLKIPYSSDASHGYLTALTNHEIPPNAGRFLVHVRCSADNLVTELLKKKEELAKLFRVQPDLICILVVFPKGSFWVLVLAPSPMVQVFKGAWERDDVKKYLESIDIDEVKFPEEKEEGARGDPGVGAASSATQSAGMEVEPPTERMKMEKSDETYHPETAEEQKREDEDILLCLSKVDENIGRKLKEKTTSEEEMVEWNPYSLMKIGLQEPELDTVKAALKKTKKFYASLITKVINDPVHKQMEFHPLCVRIIDTPEFQRLRNIKQLGSVCLVYPGATHSRFEHSLGMGHLAQTFAETLQKRHPELGITEEDVLCVTIAGLCHDLGHGPHSHLFEYFMKEARPDLDWQHNDASVMMFDYLVKKNNLMADFRWYDIGDEEYLDFIRMQIKGNKITEKEREKMGEKQFLLEIVANRGNGMDVDRWDSIARDCLMLGVLNSFDYFRFMKHARVISREREWRICSRDKEAEDVYKMFQTIHSLNRKAYQHKTVQAIEIMLVDALMLAEKSGAITFEGRGQEMLPISKCVEDPVAFTSLDDSVFSLIQRFPSDNEDLKKAKDILIRIQSRRLYQLVGESEPTKDKEHCTHLEKLTASPLSPDQVAVKEMKMDCRTEEENPLENTFFYKKKDPFTAFKIPGHQVSSAFPEHFSEHVIRLYCKVEDKDTIAIAREHFKSWLHKFRIGLKTPFLFR